MVKKSKELTAEQHLLGAAAELQEALSLMLSAQSNREANIAVIFAKKALAKSLGQISSTES